MWTSGTRGPNGDSETLGVPHRASWHQRSRTRRTASVLLVWRQDAKRLGARFASAFDLRPEFAESTAELAGVTCGYENPALLGVDRWLAVVAAWNMARQPAVVADVGTAATLDFVTRDGRHTGGYIVPGLGMMAVALARDTARVQVAGDRAPELLPGRDTAQAVRRGTTAMLLSFVEWSVARFSAADGEAPVVFLTGGDADDLAARPSFPVRVEPDLVLDGLALALP